MLSNATPSPSPGAILHDVGWSRKRGVISVDAVNHCVIMNARLIRSLLGSVAWIIEKPRRAECLRTAATR